MTSRVRIRHLDAEAAGDLVAHARIAVFHVVAERRRRLPVLVQFARKPARCAHHHVARRGVALNRADDLRVGGQFGIGGIGIARRLDEPPRLLVARLGGPRVGRFPALQSAAELLHARPWRRHTSGSALCLDASNVWTFSPMMRRSGFLNSAHEPVVKSCRRVPTASTTSASSASAFAAAVPVTPMAPRLAG